MAINVLTVFAVLGIVNFTIAGSPLGAMVLKSDKQAKSECEAYLKKKDRCEDLCKATVLRYWDKCSGIIEVPFAQHFRRDNCDSDYYYNGTLQCVSPARKMIDECHQASHESKCLEQSYGSPVRSPQLAPLTNLQASNVLESCANMLGIDPDMVELYRLFDFDVDSNSRCLFRCYLIRQGLYSDVDGPNLDRMYVQCGGYDQFLNDFKASAQECVDNLRSQCLDKCTLAIRIASDCFPRNSGPLAQALFGDLGFDLNPVVVAFKNMIYSFEDVFTITTTTEDNIV
ncbi:general odorant-binding protein 45-like [Uranotaenia lowii]|uniref:general odorant-binding protein 45-like n=1 Tax=Uranotaenia lowii TaxID=190385 RepID=UPI00247B0F91|nr:general odorant-binding protein 45-like [Uranotaenia lowii]